MKLGRWLGSVWLFLVAACAVPTPRPAANDGGVDTETLLCKALDEEALFTVAGGLKPVSISFWSQWLDVGAPDLAPLRAVRAALAPWRNGELWADVLAFDEAHDGRRAVQAYVVDRRALARTLVEHAAFFAPYGLAPDTHPAEVVAVVERMPKLDRYRGHGLLYGYPLHAIEFFVAASAQPDDGKPAPRRFVQIPTFASAEGRFVYAVPPDHVDNAADVALRDAAAKILARYRQLRAATDLSSPAALQELVERLRAEFAPRPIARLLPPERRRCRLAFGPRPVTPCAVA